MLIPHRGAEIVQSHGKPHSRHPASGEDAGLEPVTGFVGNRLPAPPIPSQRGRRQHEHRCLHPHRSQERSSIYLRDSGLPTFNMGRPAVAAPRETYQRGE